MGMVSAFDLVRQEGLSIARLGIKAPVFDGAETDRKNRGRATGHSRNQAPGWPFCRIGGAGYVIAIILSSSRERYP